MLRDVGNYVYRSGALSRRSRHQSLSSDRYNSNTKEDDDLVSMGSLESLSQLKIEGVAQFEKEVKETYKLQPANKICIMHKLHENVETEEVEER